MNKTKFNDNPLLMIVVLIILPTIMILESALPYGNPALFLSDYIPEVPDFNALPSKISTAQTISLEIGETKTITVTLEGEENCDQNLTFTTTAPNIIHPSIDNHRRLQITGIDSGEAVATISSCRDSSISAAINVTVTKPTPNECIFTSTTSSYISVGSSGNILSSFDPYYSYTDVLFSSNNPSILSVDEQGVYSALSEGEADVTAKTTSESMVFHFWVSPTTGTVKKFLINTPDQFVAGKIVECSFPLNNSQSFSLFSVSDRDALRLSGKYLVPKKRGNFEISFFDQDELLFSKKITIVAPTLISKDASFYLTKGVPPSVQSLDAQRANLYTTDYIKISKNWGSTEVNDPLYIYAKDFSYDKNLIGVDDNGVVYPKASGIGKTATITVSFFDGTTAVSKKITLSFSKKYPNGFGFRHFFASLSFFLMYCLIPLFESLGFLVIFYARSRRVRRHPLLFGWLLSVFAPLPVAIINTFSKYNNCFPAMAYFLAVFCSLIGLFLFDNIFRDGIRRKTNGH